MATYIGDGARALMARALAATGFADASDVDPLLSEFLRYYEAHPVEGTTWMREARETLEALASHPLALVTNKPRAITVRVLDALGVGTRFLSVIAGGDGPMKPDPAPHSRRVEGDGGATGDHLGRG